MGGKGRHAAATEHRRFAWSEIVWPLVTALRSVEFTLGQYQRMRDRVCAGSAGAATAASRGLASLVHRGVLLREGDTYSIHYRLAPYMRVGAPCDYATAMHEAGSG